MESNPVQMYQITKPEESNNKENVVLRALVGDPNRHKPLAQHAIPSTNASQQPLPTTTSAQESIPTAMYTLESRYRPIPQKVLPKSTEPKLYHIEANNREQSPTPDPPVTKKEPDTSPLVEQEPQPTIFLEPKIIPQPILYSIVGEKSAPVQSDQPILIDEERPSPILYTITGQVHHPTIDMSANPVDVSSPVIDKSPILYSLVGSPSHRVQIQEPIQEAPQIPEQSVPTLYSVVGSPHHQPQVQEPIKEVLPLPPPQRSTPSLYSIVGSPHVQPPSEEPIKQVLPPPPQRSIPTLYSIVGSPHLQPQIQEPIKQVLPPPQHSTPSLYSVVGNPHVQSLSQEPVKKIASLPQQTSPTLYSIVGGPVLTSRIAETNTVNLPPSMQSVKANPVQSTPIWYTVVGGRQMPINVPKENQRAPSPVKKQVKDSTMYTVIGGPNIPQAMALPHKIQPIQPQKQPQREAPIPTLYPLVGKPNTPSQEIIDTEPTSPVRRKIPPPKLVSNRRLSRSFERQSAPEAATQELAPVIQPKRKRPARSQERTIPKSETVFIPLSEDERLPRRRQPRTTPWHTSPGRINRKPHTIGQYDPLQLPDYISPYAYYPSRPYLERTLHPNLLPIVKNNGSNRKSRQPLYEPHHSTERKHPYDPWMPHSLERYPVKPQPRSRLWDYEDPIQTDTDDDMNDPDEYRRKQYYRRMRRRQPWVPVW